MSYKIAIGSTDGIHIDQSFGATKEFYIYKVEGLVYSLTEKRQEKTAFDGADHSKQLECKGQNQQCSRGSAGSCGTGGGCGTGEGRILKVSLVADCRCIVCKKIGFQVQKQLEKLAISSFDVECTIEEAMDKITTYLYKVDSHQSLRSVTTEHEKQGEVRQ